MVGHHPAHAFDRAFGPACHQHALARGLQRFQMIGGGLEDIQVAAGAFRREIAALAAAGIHAVQCFPAPGTATARAQMFCASAAFQSASVRYSVSGFSGL